MIIKTITRIFVLLMFPVSIMAQTNNKDWINEVGAKTFPNNHQIISVNDFGANNNGLILSTKAIQTAIDTCAALGGGKVVFKPGTYLTTALFLKSNVNLCIDENVELRGAIGLDGYPDIDTRVAGIEMRWPAAIINVMNQKNVAISGKGTIHAQGRYNWERYWKLREEYTPKGLRWASDYDCRRVRTILVSESEHVTVKDLTMKQSGFWTVHILYSNNVTVDGVTINNNIDGHGPSTDGIDIDSSTKILVENCDIDCNDDNFCLKAGRDADGLRVNRPTEFIVIRDCISRAGGGLITLGSETSGGINNIEVYKLTAEGTNCAIRLKSALTRGGVLSNINIHDVEMNNVRTPIEVTLNWNPAYSYASIDENVDSIPDYWKVMLKEVTPLEKGIPSFRNVTISNITAKGSLFAMNVIGVKESYLENFSFTNVNISCEKPGKIAYTKDWTFDHVDIVCKNGQELKMQDNIGFVEKDCNL